MTNREDIQLLVFDFDGVLAESAVLKEFRSYDFTKTNWHRDLVMGNASDREIAKCVSKIMFEASKSSYILYIWVGIILPILASRVKLAIYTDNCKDNIFYVLGNLMSCFSYVSTWENVEIGNLKPHPQGLCDMMRYMQIKDPSRVLLVGDTVEDLLAAKHAGTQFVAAFWGSDSGGIEYDAKNKSHLLHPESLLELIPVRTK